MLVVKRSKNNPVLEPNPDHYWEASATFNMSITMHAGFYYGLYRAVSSPDTLQNPNSRSIIGISKSRDGVNFKDRRPFILPQEEWEKYGCEDPRVTHFEGKYYTFYTALSNYPFSAEGIKVAVAVSKDLVKIDERHLVTPFNAKAMTLFPERIGGKVIAILSAHTDSPPVKIAIAEADSVKDFWDESYWQNWHDHIDQHEINLKRFPYDHVEIGAPPLKTEHGWLIIYSHIQNYFESPEHYNRIFGIEAVLLDLENPRKIIGRTRGPILVPSEHYELEGHVGNIIFPTAALIEKDVLSIYYGAADTVTALARMNLNDLMNTILPGKNHMPEFKRYAGNPILLPRENFAWEKKAVFNPAAIRIKNTTHILYRASSDDNTSTIGYAKSTDGTVIDERSSEPVYVPREDFESKRVPGGNSGCEDPRLSKIGSTIFMTYTAYNGVEPPRVAITSISERDFLANNWDWSKPSIITPEGIDDKDACLLPEKVDGQYFIFHRVGPNICGDYLSTIDEKVNKCIPVLGPRGNSWDNWKIGMAATPLKTKYGWLALYHGVSTQHRTYRIGAILLDLTDPTIVLARTSEPIFEPREEYEKVGVINNVVFPCGMVEKDGVLYIYYGGGDRVVGVATIKLDDMLGPLRRGMKL